MKLKYLIALQALALLATVIVGSVLSGDLAAGPRDMHRGLGVLAGALGLAVAILAFINKTTLAARGLSIVALILTITAAASGSSLSDTDNYDMMFNVMRAAGTVAFLVSIATFTQARDPNATKQLETEEPEAEPEA